MRTVLNLEDVISTAIVFENDAYAPVRRPLEAVVSSHLELLGVALLLPRRLASLNEGVDLERGVHVEDDWLEVVDAVVFGGQLERAR